MPTLSPREPAVPIDLPIADRLRVAVEFYGEAGAIDRAVALLAGANAGEEFLLFVGGAHAKGVLDGAPPLYWPELWGARALLYVWNDTAISAVVAGLDNPAWRVREMCARVSQVRQLDAGAKLVELLHDDVPRVRVAVLRALAVVGGAAHLDSVTALLRDPDKEVRRAAQQSRDMLAEPADGRGARSSQPSA